MDGQAQSIETANFSIVEQKTFSYAHRIPKGDYSKSLSLNFTELEIYSFAMGSTEPILQKVLGVGIIGCGEVCQTVHLPTLGHLSDYFQVTYLCDVSSDALQHCKKKVARQEPETTRDVATLCASPSVDVVFITNSNEYHAAHAIIALQHNKHVLLEKPASITIRDADAIVAAESKSRGKVFVGYMRRYAAAFVDAIEEIGGVEKILYARVRGTFSFSPYC